MSTSINKNGVWFADGSDINPNLVQGSLDFDGWTLHSSFTKEVEDDGLTTLSINVTGLTSNSWKYAYILIEDPVSVSAIKENGITISYDFMVDDYDGWDQKYTTRLGLYNASKTSIGHRYFGITTTSGHHSFDSIENGRWTRIASKYTADEIAGATYTEGYSIDDVAIIRPGLIIVRNGSIHYRRPKVEVGLVATPWVPNVSDEIYISDEQGFNEGYHKASVNPGSLNSNSFIEL